MQTHTKADQHSDSLSVQGNVSALITHLFWERGREKKTAKMKSEKVTSMSRFKALLYCRYCKFLSNSCFLFVVSPLIKLGVDRNDNCLQVQWPVIESALVRLADRQNGPCLWQNSHMEEQPGKERERGREGWEHRWKWHCKVVVCT